MFGRLERMLANLSRNGPAAASYPIADIASPQAWRQNGRTILTVGFRVRIIDSRPYVQVIGKRPAMHV